MTVGALILAAGFSHRFGSLKLQASLDSGATVFGQTLSRLQQAVTELQVITRPELLSTLEPYGVPLVGFDGAERGMGATLAFGISRLRGWDACMVCLADMPFITVSSYQAIIAQARQDRIIVPDYQGRPGNPVVFGADFFPELMNLSGDSGGRVVVKQHPQHTVMLPLDDPALLLDIDTPQDLAKAQR